MLIHFVVLVVKINIWLGVAWGLSALTAKRHPFFAVLLCRTAVLMLGVILLVSQGPSLWNIPIADRFDVSGPKDVLDAVARNTVPLLDSAATSGLRMDYVEQFDSPEGTGELPSNLETQLVTVDRLVPRDISEVSVVEIKPEFPTEYALAASEKVLLEMTGEEEEVTADKRVADSSDLSHEAGSAPLRMDEATASAPTQPVQAYAGWRDASLKTTFVVWVVISIGLFVNLIAMSIRSRMLVIRASNEPQVDVPLGEMVSRAIGSRRIALLISSEIESPCLTGIVKPTILIPRRLVNDRRAASTQLLQIAILHEVIHAARFDLVWHLVMQCIRTILWPLPWGWLLVRNHLFACERVCDELSVRHLGDRKGYRIGLARIASQMIGISRPSAALLMAKRPEIFHRLDLLLERAPSMKLGVRSVLSACLLIVFALFIASLGLNQGNAKAVESAIATVTEPANEATGIEAMETEEILDVIETSAAKDTSTVEDTASTEITSAADKSPDEPAKTSSQPRETNIPIGAMRPLRFAKDKGAPVPLPTEPTPRTGLMRGRVLDPMGRPIEGAQVVVGMMEPSRGVPIQMGAKTSTDAKGEWTWDIGRNPGVTGLRIEHKRYQSSAFPVRVATTIHETRLVPMHRFEGRVVDENDKPVSDVTVMGTWSIQTLLQDNSGTSFAFISEQKTNEDGGWWGHSKSTNLTLVATRGAGEIGVLRDAEAGEANSIRLRPAKTLQFAIMDENGKSLVGISVTPIGWLSSRFGIHATSTGDGGTASFEKTPRIISFWRLEKPGYRTRWIEVAEEQTQEQVTMHASNPIQAHVVDGLTGNPIPLSTVDYEYTRMVRSLASTEQIPTGGNLPNRMNERAVTGKKTVSNGNVQLESNLDFEWLNLKIESEGYAPFHCEPISQETSQQKRTIRLHKLPVTQIVDSDGRPILNSSLDVHANGGRHNKPIRSLRTDDRGNVVLPALGQDELLISMEQGCAFLESSPFEKFPQPASEIKLKPWGSIQIPIPHGENKILPKTATWTTNMGQFKQFRFETNTRIGTNGFIVVSRVPVGDDIGISLKLNGEKDCNLKAKVSPREIATVNPHGKHHVNGKLHFVTHDPEGLLIDYMGLYVVRRDTENLRSFFTMANTERQAEFRVENLPPGGYTAHVFWSLLKDRRPKVGEHLSAESDFEQVDRAIESGENQFEFAIEESDNKTIDLGQVTINVNRRAATEPFLVPRKVNDPFQGTEKIAFVTETKRDWHHSEIRFWTRDGRCVRTLNVGSDRKTPIPLLTLGVQKKRDRFYLSAAGRDIRGFCLDGSDVDSFEVVENCLAQIFCSDEEEVWVAVMTPSQSIHTIGLFSGRRLTDSLPQQLGSIVYSQKDQSLWMSTSNDRNRSIIRQEVIRVPLDQRKSEIRFCNGASHLQGIALLESDRGGVWAVETCTSAENRTPPWYALSRIQSDGKSQSKLVPRFQGSVEANDHAVLRYDDQIVAMHGDTNKESSLEIRSSYIADSPRPDMFWLQSGEDLVRVRVLESGMSVEERVKGVRGDRFFVVSDE